MSKRRASIPSHSRTRKSANSIPFVLGCRAFAKVSAVEGMRTSRDLEAELLNLEDAEFVARRDALAEKYGQV